MADNEQPVVKTDEKPVEQPKPSETTLANMLTEQPAEKVEESEFDFEVGAEGAAAPADEKPKFDRTRWKELDDDVDTEDEESIFARATQYKKTAQDATLVAQAHQLIAEDPSIKNLTRHLRSEDKALVLASEVAQLEYAGYSAEEAKAEAEAAVEGYDETYLKNEARKVRLQISGEIKQRTEKIQSKISETQKALSLSKAPDPAFVTKAVEAVSKKQDFLGLKFGSKNPQALKDFQKPIADKIKSGSLMKQLQSDPELFAEVAYFVEHKKDWEKAISKRGNTSKKVLEKLDKAPHSNGAGAGLPPLPETKTAEGLKNPGGFK